MNREIQHESESPLSPESELFDVGVTIDWLICWVTDRQKTQQRTPTEAATNYRSRFNFLHKLYTSKWLKSIQGWIILTIVGISCALLAAILDILIPIVQDARLGYCSLNLTTTTPEIDWFKKAFVLASSRETCISLSSNTTALTNDLLTAAKWIPFTGFYGFSIRLGLSLLYGMTAFYITCLSHSTTTSSSLNSDTIPQETTYEAAGSGIPQLKVLLSGQLMPGFLGLKTLTIKFFGLILALGAGLMLGVQGPLVHLGAGLGNIVCRNWKVGDINRWGKNPAKRREIMSAAAAAGVSVAFAAPIGGVLFSLEECSTYFPHKTMWRSFYCALIAAVCLKLLNPLGTGKLVLFQVSYESDWSAEEFPVFALIGLLGGLYGAFYIKLTRWISTTSKFTEPISQVARLYHNWSPAVKMVFLCIATTLLDLPSNLTSQTSNIGFVSILFEECGRSSSLGVVVPDSPLCVAKGESSLPLILHLLWILLSKTTLMLLTIDARIPGGIFIPSMVVGGTMGRLVGLVVQSLVGEKYQSNIIPGVYAMVGGAAVIAGVTRMTVSLAIIVFELTGRLTYVLPLMAAIMIAKFTADGFLGSTESVYDVRIKASGYLYLNHKRTRMVEGVELEDLIEPLYECEQSIIDVKEIYTLKQIREKVKILRNSHPMKDSGFPLLKGEVLVGYISQVDLEHAIQIIRDSDPDDQVVFTKSDLVEEYPVQFANATIEDALDGDDDSFHSALPATEEEEGATLLMKKPSKSHLNTPPILTTGPTQRREILDPDIKALNRRSIHIVTSPIIVDDDDDDDEEDEEDGEVEEGGEEGKEIDGGGDQVSSFDAIQRIMSPTPPHPTHALHQDHHDPNHHHHHHQHTIEQTKINLSEWVQRSPITVERSASVELALELFLKLGLRSLLVVEEGKLKGTIHKARLLEFIVG